MRGEVPSGEVRAAVHHHRGGGTELGGVRWAAAHPQGRPVREPSRVNSSRHVLLIVSCAKSSARPLATSYRGVGWIHELQRCAVLSPRWRQGQYGCSLACAMHGASRRRQVVGHVLQSAWEGGSSAHDRDVRLLGDEAATGILVFVARESFYGKPPPRRGGVVI